MARAHHWEYISNEEGQPINGVDISVYVANSSTAAYVYTSENGGSATNTLPQISTDENGYFEFWIADSSETNGYASGKFKIKWSKAGVIDEGTVDYVDIIVPSAEVDETDNSGTDLAKNKMISNELAYRWESKAGVYKALVGSTISTETLKLTLDEDGIYKCTLQHNLNNNYPVYTSYVSIDGSWTTETDVLSGGCTTYLQSLDGNNLIYCRISDDDTHITLIG